MISEGAPFYQKILLNPTKAAAYWIETIDKVKIRAAHWPSNNSKGTIFLLPGRTEYIEKYGGIAANFSKLGYNLLVVDWRGQGLADRLSSDRNLGHVDHFSDYQKDIDGLISLAKFLSLPKPWFIIAHSMGGCIALRTLLTRTYFKAVTFSGPMWGIKIAIPLQTFTKYFAKASTVLGISHLYAPTTSRHCYCVVGLFKNNSLTNCKASWLHMQNQLLEKPSLQLGGPSMKWLDTAFQEMDQLFREVSPKTKCLCFMGEKETVVSQSRIRHRMKNWPDGELVTLHKGKHEVLMEDTTIVMQVIQRIDRFFSDTNN